MASGKPIIAALEGEGADIISHANCGFVAMPDDAKALANSVLKLKKLSEGERDQLGTNGHNYYMEKFLKRKAVGKFQTLGATP